MARSLNKEQRAARLLCAIISVFIILWAPYNIMALYASRNGFQSIPPWAWSLGYWLCYLNSTLNPACYAACNQVKNVSICKLKLSVIPDIQANVQKYTNGAHLPFTEINQSNQCNVIMFIFCVSTKNER